MWSASDGGGGRDRKLLDPSYESELEYLWPTTVMLCCLLYMCTGTFIACLWLKKHPFILP